MKKAKAKRLLREAKFLFDQLTSRLRESEEKLLATELELKDMAEAYENSLKDRVIKKSRPATNGMSEQSLLFEAAQHIRPFPAPNDKGVSSGDSMILVSESVVQNMLVNVLKDLQSNYKQSATK